MRDLLIFSILLVAINLISTEGHTSSSNTIKEKIEEIARNRSSWSRQRTELYKEAGLSSVINSTNATRDSINKEISIMAEHLFHSPLPGNAHALVELIEQRNAQYIIQLKNNLPNKFLINLASRRIDFKFKNGESIIGMMSFDTDT